MQTRHERRRRVLSDEVPQGISGKDKKGAGRRRRFYAAAARRDQQPRITDVVPMRYRMYSLLAALGLAIIGLIEFLHTRVALLGKVVPAAELLALDVSSSRSLANCFSAMLLFSTGVMSLLVYSLRRHRVDDYHGRYRLWVWTGLLSIIGGIHQSTGVLDVVRSLLVWYTQRVHIPGPNPWTAMCVTILTVLAVRLVLEIRRARGATTLAVLGGGLLAIAAVFQSRSPALTGTLEVMLIAAGHMVGTLLLLFSVGLYARRVIREAEGLVDLRKKKKRKHKPGQAMARQSSAEDDDESDSPAASPMGDRPSHSSGPAHAHRPGMPGSSPLAAKVQAVSISDYEDDDDDDEEVSAAPEHRGLSRAERKRLRREKRLEQRRAA